MFTTSRANQTPRWKCLQALPPSLATGYRRLTGGTRRQPPGWRWTGHPRGQPGTTRGPAWVPPALASMSRSRCVRRITPVPPTTIPQTTCTTATARSIVRRILHLSACRSTARAGHWPITCCRVARLRISAPCSSSGSRTQLGPTSLIPPASIGTPTLRSISCLLI